MHHTHSYYKQTHCGKDGCDSCHTHFHGAIHKVVDAHFRLCKLVTHCVFGGVRRALHGSSSHSCHAAEHCHDTSCCTVPEPCWMPVSLGEICCHLCPKASGEVELIIVNEDYRPREVNIEASGAHAALVQFSHSQIMLAPKERVSVKTTFTAPTLATSSKFEQYDLLLWIKGCQNHYLRWIVDVSKSRHSHCCNFEIPVHDKPDYETHWYDHFYCNTSHCGCNSKVHV